MKLIHWVKQGKENELTLQHYYSEGDVTTLCGLYVPQDRASTYGPYLTATKPRCLACIKKFMPKYVGRSHAITNNG